MHALAAYTREGTLFAVDARLRPRGGEGELVITPGELERYLAEEAQPWEALTYTKLRFVAGAKAIADSLLPVVHQQIVQIAAAHELGGMEEALKGGNAFAVVHAVAVFSGRTESTSICENVFGLSAGLLRVTR